MSTKKIIGDKALLTYINCKMSMSTKTQEHYNAFKRKHQRGAIAVEYGLVLAIIVAVVVAAAGTMSDELETFFGNAVTKITTWMGS